MPVAKLHFFCVIIFRVIKQLLKFALFHASLHVKDVCIGGKEDTTSGVVAKICSITRALE